MGFLYVYTFLGIFIYKVDMYCYLLYISNVKKLPSIIWILQFIANINIFTFEVGAMPTTCEPTVAHTCLHCSSSVI